MRILKQPFALLIYKQLTLFSHIEFHTISIMKQLMMFATEWHEILVSFLPEIAIKGMIQFYTFRR